jgi:hypothetical protein
LRSRSFASHVFVSSCCTSSTLFEEREVKGNAKDKKIYEKLNGIDGNTEDKKKG